MYQEKMTGEYLAIREIKAKLKKEQLFLDEKFKATKKVLESDQTDQNPRTNEVEQT